MSIALHVARYSDTIRAVQIYHERTVPCENHAQNQSVSSIKESHFAAILSRNGGQIVCTLFLMLISDSKALADSIKKSGKMPMGLFQRDVISIMEMGTRSIMSWKIWNASLSKNIVLIIVTYLLMSNENKKDNMPLLFETLHLSGISPKQGEHGIQKWEKQHGRMQKCALIFVNIAEKSSPTQILAHNQSIAQISVNRLLVVHQGLIMNKGYVLDVGKHLPRINIVVFNVAQLRVFGGYGKVLDAARYVAMHLDQGKDIDQLDEETARAISSYRGM